MDEFFVDTDVPNYQVSNLGRIKRLAHIQHRKDGKSYQMHEVFIKPWTCNQTGYPRVKISNHHRFIHRLVATAFIPNADNKPQVNHKDGNRLNFSIENLEWCTQSENNQHSYDFLGKKGAFLGKVTAVAKPIRAITRNGDFIGNHQSILRASQDHNISPITIMRSLRTGKSLRLKDLKFEYAI